MDEDQELLQDFRTESLEHMSEIEPLFLEIEDLEGEAQLEVVNQIFRAAHSVKGAAGFFGLDRIQNLAHIMENLLMRVRDGELAFHPEMTDALLIGVDKLTQLIEGLPETLDLSIDEEVARLKPLIEGKSGETKRAEAAAPDVEAPAAADPEAAAEVVANEASPAVEPPESESAASDGDFPTFVVEPDVAEEIARFGQRIYGVVFDSVKLSDKTLVHDARKRAAAIGKVVGAATSDTCGGVLTLQIASVLESDLMAGALEVPNDHIRMLADRVVMSDERLAEATNIKLKPKLGNAGPSEEAAVAESAESAESTPVEAAAAQAEETSAPEAPAAQEENEPEAAAAPPTPPPADTAGSGRSDGGSQGDKKPKAATKKIEAAETVRVAVDLLDKLMDLAGELVLGRNQLLARLDQSDDPGVKAVLQNIDIVTSDLQSNIMNTRMQPVGNVFKKYHRVVRDLSRKLGKKVVLEIQGSDVELDKSIIELLSDPLTHLVRNSLDHGLEPPPKRVLMKKDETGNIILRAFHEGGQVNIEIADDGRGIDPEKTRKAAVEKELLSEEEAALLSDQDAVMLVFSAGFSLAAQVTEVSGRGVGMDVVRANIEKLGGKIEVDSVVNVGTTIRIRLPLTLAIVPSLIVVVGAERFAVPQVNLVEIVRVKASEVASRLEQIKGADVLRLRGRLLPLVRLADVLEIPRFYTDPETGEQLPDTRGIVSDRRNDEVEPLAGTVNTRKTDSDRRSVENQSAVHVVVLRSGEHRYGLIVDRIADSEEIVVKPLSQFLKGCRCYAGATIMGDGRVAMILDVGGIATEANLRFHETIEEADGRAGETTADGLSRRELILFANAAEEQFAVDLEQIVRLEKVEAGEIEHIGGSEFMQHLGKGLPLIRLESQIRVSPIDAECEEFYVLIPRGEGSTGGILASRVIDTVDTAIALDHSSDDEVCVNGRAVIQGRLTTFLDAEKLLASALGEAI